MALQLRKPVSGRLIKDQVDVFNIALTAGQFAHVELQKNGVEALFTVVDSSGKTILTCDSPNGLSGAAPGSWIAAQAGTYLVRVTPAERAKQSGSYELELTETASPSDRQKTQIQVETKFYAAAEKDRSTDRAVRLSAIPLYEEAATGWRELGNAKLEALSAYQEGSIQSAVGDQEKALEPFRRSLGIARAAGDTIDQARALNAVGLVYARLGDQQKALTSYLEALPQWKAAADQSGEILTLNNIANSYLTLGEQQKALDVCEQALAIRRANGDRSGEAAALINIASINSSQGDQQKALDAFQQVLAIRRSIGDRQGQAYVFILLANTYRDLGAEQKALDYYQLALEGARASGDHSTDADALMGNGDVYFFLGEKQKSLDAYQQSLTLKLAAKDRSGEALALIGMGNVYSNLAARQKASDAPTQAEQEKALEYYEKSLAIGRAAGDYPVQVFALMGAGVAYSVKGDKPKAMTYLNQALFLFGAVHFRPGEGWARYEMARVERDRGNLTQARVLVAKARESAESIRSKVLSGDLRASFLAAVQDCYSLEMDILMRLHATDPSKGFQAEALSTSEHARARVLLETLSEAHADIRQGADPHLLERERIVQSQLNAKEMARLQMLASKHTPEMAHDIETALRDLTAEYQDLNTQIRARSPHYAALRFPEPLSLQGIQKEVLDPETILLEFALGEQRSFLWLVSTNGITGVILPKRAEVEEATRRFHDTLVDRTKDPAPAAAKALSQMLLGEVASILGNKRLLIVADGLMQYLPFAALPDPNAWEQPLVVNHEIVNVPSASTLAVLRRENAGRPPAPKILAILADPVFSADDSRITRNQQKRVATGKRSVDETERSLDDLGLSGFRLPRLPGTRREAAAIAALVPEDSRKRALDFDANRATLTSPDVSQYRILHLATHGLLNTVHPELSGIVLSLVDSNGKAQDGFLRLHEIYNLKLQADLVVLSACQTGLGKEIQGEGLVGLTRGFMYAGAPRVLASLWKVDDRATAELMKSLYTGMLGSAAYRPAAALRAAQIELWKTKGWENPYYWAAFTLQGEWK